MTSMETMRYSQLIEVPPRGRGQGYNVYVEHTCFDVDRETILFLHGYLGSIDDYKTILERFSGNYNTIAIDIRGHGRSEFPDEDEEWSLSSLAYDIHFVIERLVPYGLKLHIVASSMSTAIALVYANLYQDRVEKLFLISPSAEFVIPTWGRIILGMGRYMPSFTRTLVNITVGIIPLFLGGKKNKEFAEKAKAKIKDLDYETHSRIMTETVKSWELDVSQINQYVLIIAGENDPVIPYEDSVELNSLLENSSIITVKNSGHYLLAKRNEMIMELIELWLMPNMFLDTDFIIDPEEIYVSSTSQEVVNFA